MNFKSLIFLSILFVALIAPASAVIINTTVLLTTNYGGDLHLGNSQTTSGQFVYSAPNGNMIVFTTFYPKNEGQTLNWVIDRNNGFPISGSIRLEDAGLFSGNTVSTINGGTTASLPYTKVVALKYNPPMTIFYVKGDSYYYLVIADNSRFNYAVSGDIFHPVYAPFLLNTETDCYLQLSENPTTYPPSRITVNPLSSGEYTVTPYYESVYAAVQAEQYTNATQASVTTGDTLSFLQALINLILSAVRLLENLANTIGPFLSILAVITAFIFAGQIFIGMNAIYVAIAILLAIEDSDDIFRAFGNFHRRMMKLFRFYMELFRAMKDILKWW